MLFQSSIMYRNVTTHIYKNIRWRICLSKTDRYVCKLYVIVLIVDLFFRYLD
jgi:hypothetical protein